MAYYVVQNRARMTKLTDFHRGLASVSQNLPNFLWKISHYDGPLAIQHKVTFMVTCHEGSQLFFPQLEKLQQKLDYILYSGVFWDDVTIPKSASASNPKLIFEWILFICPVQKFIHQREFVKFALEMKRSLLFSDVLKEIRLLKKVQWGLIPKLIPRKVF